MAADTPTIIAPAASELLPGVGVWRLLKNPYSGAGTQRECRWQVATDSGFGASTILWDSLLRENDDHSQGDDWAECYPETMGATQGDTLYIRAMVRNSSSESSSWSSTRTVTVEARATMADWRAAV